MLTFQMIGNTLPIKDYRALFEKIKKLGKDFTFFVEARAGRLKSEDYKLLKEAGFSDIQTGIETFSQNYIKKMNKGTRVIDNIASLKFCKENGINNRYNIIVNYPNEERIDFEETKKNIQLFKQYLDPPNISFLQVGFGSPIYNNQEEFNIRKLDYLEIDKIMFPKEFLEKNISFFYSFERNENLGENDWDEMVKNWKKEREKFINEGIKRQSDIDKLVFYFVDGGNFLRIYDKRDGNNVLIYILDEIERAIFLSCIDVISFQKLSRIFSHIPDHQLAAILHTFEKNGIVFQEDNYYLSLPLRYSQVIYQLPKRELQQQLIYNSGNQRSL